MQKKNNKLTLFWCKSFVHYARFLLSYFALCCCCCSTISGSISRGNFRQFKRFLERLVDEFDVSESGTHVALVEYSTEASVQLRFNELTGAQLNAVNVKRKIQKLPHTQGYTYIDKALELADTEIFSEKGGMRANVSKVNVS